MHKNEQFATIHVGFCVNEKKGTRRNRFIPKEYHELVKKNIRDIDIGVDENYDLYRRYYEYTNSGMWPFSCMYNWIRDMIAGNMMKDWNYKHCEIAFDQDLFSKHVLRPVNGIPYTEECLVSYGTNMRDGKIFRKPRTFKNRSVKKKHNIEPYEWIHLRVSLKSVQRLIAYADQEIGKEYDAKTLEHLLLHPRAIKPVQDWEQQKWHCTNFTIHILQQAGFLRGLDPNCLTADDVYYYLKNNAKESKVFMTPVMERENTLRIQTELQKCLSQY